MYDNNDPILNNTNIDQSNENIVREERTSAEETHAFVLVDQPAEVSQAEAAREEAVKTDAQPTEAAGKFSGNYVSEPVVNAKVSESVPAKKKVNWGKRIVVLLLCGLLLGASTASAYYGVTQLINRFTPEKVENSVSSNFEVVEIPEKKEPQVSKVEPSSPVQSGNVTVGVAYDVSPVVESVMPAMVSIINNYTETVQSFFGQSFTQEGASSGSGIIIGENETELLIATNFHVVEGTDRIEITFIDGSVAEAFIKGTNPDMDLAVVSVKLDSLSAETKASIAVASLGNSDGLKLGQPVIAIGNALGYGQSVTTGVVSAVDREISIEEGSSGRFIQTDAAINPGNSGGALLNMAGEVIGINSSKIGGSAIEGMGYAIPISAAQPIISDLSLQTTKIKVDEAERGFLGVSIYEVTASDSQRFGMPLGVYIGEFAEDSAAKAGGMQIGDIIVGFDSFTIKSYADLQEALQYFSAGTTVTIEVKRVQNRAYESVFLEVTLAKKSQQ